MDDKMLDDAHEAEESDRQHSAHEHDQCENDCPFCEDAEVVQAGLITLRLRPEPVSASPSVTVKFAVEDGEMWQTLVDDVMPAARRWHIADLEVALVDPTKLFDNTKDVSE